MEARVVDQRTEDAPQVHCGCGGNDAPETGPFLVRAHAPDGHTFVLSKICDTREEALSLLDSHGVRAAESFGYRNEVVSAGELNDEDILNSLPIVTPAACVRLTRILEGRRAGQVTGELACAALEPELMA